MVTKGFFHFHRFAKRGDKWQAYKKLNDLKVSLKLDEEPLRLDLSTSGFAFPGDCSVVIIAGDYIRNVDQVIRTVENMIPSMKATPLAIFVALEDSNSPARISSTNSKLPTLVNKKYVTFRLKLESIVLRFTFHQL